MKIDVVNTDNKKVGSLELNDDVFGGRVNDVAHLGVGRAHERVGAPRHAQDQEPRERRGQRPQAVEAEGHRPRARRQCPQPAVAPWRHGVRASAAQLRLPSAAQGEARRDRRGARRSGFRMARSSWSTRSARAESKTKAATELLKRLGADGKALLIDVQPDEKLGIAVRNLPGVQFLRERARRRARRDERVAGDRDEGRRREASGPVRAESREHRV